MTTANQFLENQFLWWLVQNGVTVAVMIPLVMLACRALRNRPAVQHALWVVVLVKFVTPSFVVWPWALPQIGGEPAPQAKANAAPAAGDVRELLDLGDSTIDAGELLAESPGIVESEPIALDDTARHAEFAAASGSLTAHPNAGPLLTIAALVLWLIGSGVYAVRQMWRMARHAALVRESSPAPRQLARAVAATARLLRLRPPHAVVAGGIRSPFVWCLGRLRLVWPEEMTGHEEVDRSRGVIAHELAHVRRRDHRVAWLELAAGIIWWWNPLFWLARRRLRESAEMACDALALSAFPEHRRDYAEMLLQLSSRVTQNAPAPVLGIGSGSRSSFERRLSMVLSDRVSGQLSAWGIVAAVLVALVAIPGWSAGQQAAENEAPPAADQPVKAGEVILELQDLDEVKAVSADLTGVPDAKGVLVLAAQLAEDDQEDVKEVLRTLLPKTCLTFDKGEKVSLKSCMNCHATQPKKADPAKQPARKDASSDKREQLYEARMKKLEAAITELHQRLAQEKDLVAAEAAQRKAADEYRTKVRAKLAEPMRKGPVAEPKMSSNNLYRAKGAQLVPENVAAEQGDVGLKYIDVLEKYKTARAKLGRYSKEPGLVPESEIEETKIALAGSQKKLEYLASMADLAVEQAKSELAAAGVAMQRAAQLAKDGVISLTEVEELKLRLHAAGLQLKKAERVRQATSAAADSDDGGSAKPATGKTSALKRPSDQTAAENFRKAYSFLKANQDQQDVANQAQNAKVRAQLQAAQAKIKELEAEAHKLRKSLTDPEPAKKSDAPPAEDEESSAAKPAAQITAETRLVDFIPILRRKAAQDVSINRLKQIGIAMHNYESSYKVLPPAASTRDGKALLSWRVRILPYIEQQALYDKFRHDEPWDSTHNAALVAEMPELYSSPQVKLPAGHTAYLATTGKGLVFDGDHATKFSDILDGTSNTIMVVEADAERAVPWTKPDDLAVDLAKPMAGLGGIWEDGFLATFCDGSVQFLKLTIDPKTLANLFQKADGNAIDRR